MKTQARYRAGVQAVAYGLPEPQEDPKSRSKILDSSDCSTLMV